jgi:hypothetical protein
MPLLSACASLSSAKPAPCGDHPHGLAGDEPLAALDVGLAQGLARPEVLRQRPTDGQARVDQGGGEFLGQVDLGLGQVGLGENAASGGAAGTTRARPNTLTVTGR